MKQQHLALLVHLFKNQLYSRERLKDTADACGKALSELLEKNPGLRLNVVMPGYVLEAMDGLLLSELREHQKRGAVEWLVNGYTEPFLSLSPVWLTAANIRTAVSMVQDLLGYKASGFVPPFSNFEPLVIETLRELGLNYLVVSTALLPAGSRERCGYWATEHLGAWNVVFPSHVLHPYNVPSSLSAWLQDVFDRDESSPEQVALAGVHYLLGLDSVEQGDPLGWLKSAARSLGQTQEKFRTVLYNDFLGENQPLGLQYLPAALDVNREGVDLPGFRNWLFTHQQVGMLHRRLLEVCDAVQPLTGQRGSEKIIRELFFVQDINRMLPAPESGITHLADRFWTYGKLLEIEKQLPGASPVRGGQIRITDQLRNGTKSIIMANRALRASVNHRSGGALYELDFYGRCVNLLAGSEPQPADMPHVLLPGYTRMAFVDHLLPSDSQVNDLAGHYRELGDFVRGWFEYSVNKTPTGVKAVLARQGIIQQGERNCPLNMEKVFGLEKDRAELSFTYQLENASIAAYRFTFATELTLALPGVAMGKGRLVIGRKKIFDDFVWEHLALDEVTELAIEDWLSGVRVTIQSQKPLRVLCYPVGSPSQGYQGTALVLSIPIELGGNALWTLMGRVAVRAIRRR